MADMNDTLDAIAEMPNTPRQRSDFFEVTGPDGQSHYVPKNPGVTKEDALNFVKKEKYGIGTGGAGTGVLKSGMKMNLGIKDLLGVADEQDYEFMDKLTRESEGSTPAKVGEVAGDVAQYAIPGTAAYKMTKGMAGMLPLAIEAATMGTVGATRMPREDKTRTEEGLTDVAATLTGQMLMKTLSKIGQGVRQTPEAKELIDKGVRLTPGQAAEGPLPKAVEYAMSIMPFASRGVDKAKQQAVEDWSLVALKEAAPKGMADKITKTGVEGNKQLKELYDDAYSSAWAMAGKPTQESLKDVFVTADRGMRDLTGESANVLKRLRDNVSKYLENPTAKGLKDLDNKFRKAESTARGGATPSPILGETVESMRAALRGGVSKEAQQALREVDSTYGNYLAVRKGATGAKALGEGAVVAPKDLMRGSKGVGGETRAFTGAAPMQDFAEQGIKVLEQRSPNALIDMTRGIMMHTPNLLARPTGGRIMLGQTAPQRTIQEISESAVADALRAYGITPGSLAAASDMYE